MRGLPVIPAFGGSRPSEASAPEGHVVSSVVLILDEALAVRRLLQEILVKLGTAERDLRLVETPEEALEIFKKERPRLTFTEFIGTHPDEGLDMIHAMLDADPQAKIVLLTAEPKDAPEVRAAIRAGAFAHVEKPLRHEKIRAILAEIDAEEGGIERFR